MPGPKRVWLPPPPLPHPQTGEQECTVFVRAHRVSLDYSRNSRMLPDVVIPISATFKCSELRNTMVLLIFLGAGLFLVECPRASLGSVSLDRQEVCPPRKTSMLAMRLLRMLLLALCISASLHATFCWFWHDATCMCMHVHVKWWDLHVHACTCQVWMMHAIVVLT